MSRRNPETVLLHKLAAEECWDREYIVWEMMTLVHNGAAARKTLEQREHVARQRGGQVWEQGTHPRHADNVTRPGRRAIAQRSIINALRLGTIVIGDDGIVRPAGDR